ncbi:MAG: 50S ribosomal protein L25 [Ktedonobacterales bacterium]
MTIQTHLQAEHRTVMGKAVRHLRQQGIIPGNLTGQHMQPLAIQVQTLDIDRLLKTHGRATVIQLAVAATGAPRTVMIGHVQRDAISGAIKHIDFVHVEMSEKMSARISLHPVGEAPAVTNNVGIVLQLLNSIEVEALPDDLPQTIGFAISGLVDVDDKVYVRDLLVPATVLVHAALDEAVARVSQTRRSVEALSEPSGETLAGVLPAQSSGA